MKSLIEPWLWKMAWRDSRSSRKRLLIFMSSIIMGIAALMAISSFGVNLQLGLERQAKTLLGADLVIRSRQPLSDEAEKLIHTIGGETSREISFSSMVFFPKNGATRLAQIRATDGKFPFYGELETSPPLAATGFMDGPVALVEDGLMLQYDVQNGDAIKIGAFEYKIGGRLKKVPGETAAAGMIGARVYIPIAYLSQTRLFQRGSSATYKVYFKLPPQVTAEQIVKKYESEFLKLRLDTETVEERKANLGRSLENAYDFLNLVGFISLLLGSIGVASAIHVYVKQKISTIAVMRCLGARERQTFAIYLIQTFSLGLVGAFCGILLGLGHPILTSPRPGRFSPLECSFPHLLEISDKSSGSGAWGLDPFFTSSTSGHPKSVSTPGDTRLLRNSADLERSFPLASLWLDPGRRRHVRRHTHPPLVPWDLVHRGPFDRTGIACRRGTLVDVADQTIPARIVSLCLEARTRQSLSPE